MYTHKYLCICVCIYYKEFLAKSLCKAACLSNAGAQGGQAGRSDDHKQAGTQQKEYKTCLLFFASDLGTRIVCRIGGPLLWSWVHTWLNV